MSLDRLSIENRPKVAIERRSRGLSDRRRRSHRSTAEWAGVRANQGGDEVQMAIRWDLSVFE
jgi:hypothetical protein